MAQLERLRYFVAVAEERHFGRAAERLFIAQPTLSQQVKRLEAELGVQLFDRDSHGLELTAAGEALLARIRPALLGVDEAIAAARQAGSGTTGHLEVGFLPAAVGALMGKAVRAFRAAHPGVTVALRQHDFTDTSAGLLNGKVDIAFVRRPIGGEHLEFLDLLSEPRVLAVAPDHPLAHREAIEIREAFGEPWVVVATQDPVWRDFWLATAHRDQPALVGPQASNPDAAFAAVLAGQGVLLTRRSIAARFEQEGVRIVQVSDVEPSIGSAAWRLSHRTPLVDAFLTVVQDVADSGPLEAPHR